jgi:hypothetical protein
LSQFVVQIPLLLALRRGQGRFRNHGDRSHEVGGVAVLLTVLSGSVTWMTRPKAS